MQTRCATAESLDSASCAVMTLFVQGMSPSEAWLCWSAMVWLSGSKVCSQMLRRLVEDRANGQNFGHGVVMRLGEGPLNFGMCFMRVYER